MKTPFLKKFKEATPLLDLKKAFSFGPTYSAAREFIVSQLYLSLPKQQMVYISSGNSIIAASQINAWLDKNVFQNLPLTHLKEQKNTSGTTPLFDLQKTNHLIMSASQATAKGYPSPKKLAHQTITLKPDSPMTLSALKTILNSFGYEYSPHPNQPNSFTIKGDTLIVSPVNKTDPVFITFDGPKISALRQLEVIGSKITPFNELSIAPLALESTEASLVDYLVTNPDILLIIDQTEESLDLPPNRNKVITLDPLQKDSGPRLEIDLQPLPQTLNTPIKVIDHLNQLPPDWQKVFLGPKDPLLPPALEPVDKIVFPKSRGKSFHSPAEKLIVVTPDKLEHAQAKIYKIKTPPLLIQELKPGDFVVHLDHGIGIYDGMVNKEVKGVAKDLLVIKYAAGDRLFLPVEYAEKISRYLGSSSPQINRLHGSSWEETKRKVKKEARVTAMELLNLYAQREVSRKKPIGTTAYPITEELIASFPYRETPDQTKAWREISADMEKDKPMDRLLCGDVGFGKTELAIRAAVKNFERGYQTAILCPTTILAEQHFKTFTARLKNLPIRVVTLSRFKSKSEQAQTIELIKNNQADIIIGTHRLLSGDIKFANLGLIIIDEEQKFGVEAKDKLKKMRTNIDILALSATPIPRTLHLSLSGLRDISLIQTPPEGRQAVQTFIEPYSEKLIKKAIDTELERGGQVYFLHNRVKTIQPLAEKIQKIFPEAHLGIAHGQMAENTLAQTMADFYDRKIDILICSTIIENGLDNPRVNTLIVDDATRFGLSQLYQLRGRIGRGERKAEAYFFYKSQKLTPLANRRLQALLRAKELGAGFNIASEDLEIRGSGSILSTKQSGHVTAVGLSLYCQLLHQAVADLQDEVAEEKTPIDPKVDLPIPSYLPEDLIPNSTERVKIYQTAANAPDLPTLNQYKDDLKARLSPEPFPQPLSNLFDLLEIKILAKNAGVTKIETKNIYQAGTPHPRLYLHFAEKLPYAQISLLIAQNPHWDFDSKTLKIDHQNLPEPYINTLKESLNLLRSKK